MLEVAEFIWNWFPGLTGNEEHIWMGKTGDFYEKNTDRYLGRRPSLAKAGDPEFDSFKVFCVCLFVCLLVHKSQCLHIYNNNN